jgi:hypothetical protein
MSVAKARGYELVDEFYDAAVSGADPVTERRGFKEMLDRIASDGVSRWSEAARTVRARTVQPLVPEQATPARCQG